MCGICGLVDFVHGQPVEEAILRVMCQAMIHRGPDDEGIFLDGAVGLGARHLSIIDLEGGHQPIHKEVKS